MSARPLPRLLLPLLALLFAACGDGVTRDDLPALAVTTGARPIAADSIVTLAADLPTTFTLHNQGSATLQIRGLTLESTPPGAFTLVSLPAPTLTAPITLEPGFNGHTFTIQAAPLPEAGAALPRATVTVTTNSTVNTGQSFTFSVMVATTRPALIVSPPSVDFGRVRPAESAQKTLNLLNTGSAPLHIDRLQLLAPAGFSLRFAATDYAPSATPTPLASPVTIAPGQAAKLDVTYFATSAEPATAELALYSDATAADTPTRVPLFANASGPCLRMNPARLDFGGRQVNTSASLDLDLTSCGESPLVISSLTVSGGAAARFTLDTPPTTPLTLAPGATQRIRVTYRPTAIAPLGPSGPATRDESLLEITSDAYQHAQTVALVGFGTDGSCPVAVITSADPQEVPTQTSVRLSAASSAGGSGAITRWEWSVIQPAGSASSFFPSAVVRDVTLPTHVAGDYLVRLRVWDAAGTESCAPAEYHVTAIADSLVHVELLWHTPGDFDEFDEGGDNVSWSAGSDLDLHLAHPFGVKFGDVTWDCYYENPRPLWASAGGPAGNPRLDRDDTDGAGPENLNLDKPDPSGPLDYRVGVQYWNDWGYGTSEATIRIYINNVLREEWRDVTLRQGDLWESHLIKVSPDGTVAIERVGTPESPKIAPYVAP